MSSTLHVRKTPKPTNNLCDFKQPVKGVIARRFYDHDGSLGGGTITIGPEELDWFKGVLDGASNLDASERRGLEKIIAVLEDGDTIDMWFST